MKKRIKSIITNPLFSGSAIMIFGSNFASALNYLYHFVMGKLLIDPSHYGELVALISLTGLLGIIPGSFSLVIVKYISAAKTDEEIRLLTDWLKRNTVRVGLGSFITIALISPLIASFLNISSVWFVLLIGISFLFSLPSLVNKSILQGLLRFKEAIYSLLSENITKLVLSIFLVSIGFGVGGALVSIIIAIIIGWYVSILYLKLPKSKDYAKLPKVKSMISFALPVMIQSVAITSLYTSDVLLVKHFFSPYDAGIYAAISTLGKIIFFGTGPIGAVMFPIISQRQSKGENYTQIFLYSLSATSFFAICLLSLYWLFPSFVITTLYKASYLQAKDLLFWFGLFISLFTISSLLITYNLSLGRTRVIVFPLLGAISQIVLIWFYHQSLFGIIIISILVTALLLVSLLIYSSYNGRFLR